MADAPDSTMPQIVSDFNGHVVKLLKSIPDADFVMLLSHPGTLARVAADQQQQQQQQQVRRPSA